MSDKALSRDAQARSSRLGRSSISATISATALALLLLAIPAAAQITFTEVGEEMGIILPPQTLTESLAWGDYDADGDQDLFLSVNGPDVLFRNDGDHFTDVTAATGIGNDGFSVGTAWGDLDNDGDLDLYVVSFGSSSTDAVYRNEGPIGPAGEHRFTDVTALSAEAFEGGRSSSRGVAYVDFDRDGLLDIYVNAIGPDILYRNLGEMRFVDVTREHDVFLADGQGVGVVASDLDGDGWVDLFTGNRSFAPNRLFRNVSGTYDEMTGAAGIVATGLGMGVLAFDYDNDLDMDLYWTSWPAMHNVLYENVGGMQFIDVTAASGTGDPAGWGISANTADVDLDGWEDFFVTNGFDPSTTPNVLFVNNGDGTFRDETSALEGGAAFDGRGVAFADMDGDGDLDFAVTAGPTGTTKLYRNDTPTDHHWLVLDLVGNASNRSAIGARVEVTTALGRQLEEVSGGAGRGSFNSLPIELGLGAAEVIESLVVRWPSGTVSTYENGAVDRHLVMSEKGRILMPRRR